MYKNKTPDECHVGFKILVLAPESVVLSHKSPKCQLDIIEIGSQELTKRIFRCATGAEMDRQFESDEKKELI